MNEEKGRPDPFAEALTDFDPTNLKPPKQGRGRPRAADVGELAEDMNFPSRQRHVEQPKPTNRPDRRRRTGRNVQVGMKVTQEAVDLLHKTCDELDLPYGEALYQGLLALRREHKLGD